MSTIQVDWVAEHLSLEGLECVRHQPDRFISEDLWDHEHVHLLITAREDGNGR